MKKLLFGNSAIHFTLGLVLISCGYKQNIMFKVPEGYAMKEQVNIAEGNYIIRKNDVLQIDVFTNKGERIIDPDLELSKETGNQKIESKTVQTYLVNASGVVNFPMIGEVALAGIPIQKAEEILQQSYSVFYKDAFVILKCVNKRVIVLGAPGGQVIPLTNENVRLVEVLALAKGLTNDAMAHNIRVLRGDQVFLLDLSTIEGYAKNNIIIESGDIVYVEPVRRPVSEGLRDYGLVISMVTSLATLVIVIFGLQ